MFLYASFGILPSCVQLEKSLIVDFTGSERALITSALQLTPESARSYSATALRYFPSSAGLAQLVERLIRN